MEKYIVLIKNGSNEAKRYGFENLKITASFLGLTINQVRERMSWFNSYNINGNTWINNQVYSYQVFPKKIELNNMKKDLTTI